MNPLTSLLCYHPNYFNDFVHCCGIIKRGEKDSYFVDDNVTYEHVDDNEGINDININNSHPEGNINPGVYSHGSSSLSNGVEEREI